MRKNGFLAELGRNRVMFAMLIPAFLFFFVNNYVPMIGIYYAFTRFTFSGGLFGSPFVGLANFKFLFDSGKLVQLTVNTLSYNLAFIVVGNFLQIVVAIAISRSAGKGFRKLTQSVIFLPYFVSFVILNAIVYNVFNYDIGFLNGLLKGLGLPLFDAYNSPAAWRPLMVVFYVWKWLGYGTVIYLAAITAINPEYYEAARLDGASAFQQVRLITLPLLKTTFIILLLFSLGRIMRGQFDLFYQVIGTNGVLYDATDILDTYVYRVLKQDFDVGMGTAAGLYQSVFGFIVIMVANQAIKRRNAEYALF